MNGGSCLTLHVIVCIDIWYTPGEGNLGLTVIVVLFINCIPLCVCVFVCLCAPSQPGSLMTFLNLIHQLSGAAVILLPAGRLPSADGIFSLPQHDQSHRIRSQVVNTQFSLPASAFEPINHLIFSSVCCISPNSVMFRCMTSVISFYIVICHAAHRCCPS